jgi:hypothetical protein
MFILLFYFSLSNEDFRSLISTPRRELVAEKTPKHQDKEKPFKKPTPKPKKAPTPKDEEAINEDDWTQGGAYRDRAKERQKESEFSFAKIQQETMVKTSCFLICLFI